MYANYQELNETISDEQLISRVAKYNLWLYELGLHDCYIRIDDFGIFGIHRKSNWQGLTIHNILWFEFFYCEFNKPEMLPAIREFIKSGKGIFGVDELISFSFYYHVWLKEFTGKICDNMIAQYTNEISRST